MKGKFALFTLQSLYRDVRELASAALDEDHESTRLLPYQVQRLDQALEEVLRLDPKQRAYFVLHLAQALQPAVADDPSRDIQAKRTFWTALYLGISEWSDAADTVLDNLFLFSKSRKP